MIDLGTNALLPHAHANELAAALSALVARAEPERVLNYQPHAGRPEHRAIGAEFLRHLKVPAEASDTILTSGGQHAMAVSLGTLTAPGDTVLCESVTYTGMRSLANHLHVRLQGVAMDDEGLIADALEDAALESGGKVLYCMPTVQNPTGRVMSKKRRQEIARVAARLNLLIVEDDAYGFLVEGLPSLAALVPERTFYIRGFSKSVVPGLRVALMRMPASWVERVTGAVFATTVMVPPIESAAAAEWMQNGTVDRVAAWKREEIRARQEIARKIFGRIATGARREPAPVGAAPRQLAGRRLRARSASTRRHRPARSRVRRRAPRRAQRRPRLSWSTRRSHDPQTRPHHARRHSRRYAASVWHCGVEADWRFRRAARTCSRRRPANACEPANRYYGRTISSGRRTIMLRSGPGSSGGTDRKYSIVGLSSVMIGPGPTQSATAFGPAR